MAEEEKETTEKQDEEQAETTEKVDNSLEEDLKIFMADVQGQITNLTQMIEKMNPVADESAEEKEEESEEKEEEKEEEETDTDSEVEALLKDI